MLRLVVESQTQLVAMTTEIPELNAELLDAGFQEVLLDLAGLVVGEVPVDRGLLLGYGGADGAKFGLGCVPSLKDRVLRRGDTPSRCTSIRPTGVEVSNGSVADRKATPASARSSSSPTRSRSLREKRSTR